MTDENIAVEWWELRVGYLGVSAKSVFENDFNSPNLFEQLARNGKVMKAWLIIRNTPILLHRQLCKCDLY